MPLLLIFIIFPLVEMLLLFEVAEEIGGWTTLGLVVLTAVLGIAILRHQGWSTLVRARRRVGGGELPGREMIEGFFIAMGGLLLVIPGFITDAVGLLLLIPATRRALIRKLVHSGRVQVFAMHGMRDRFRRGNPDVDVYEGEFKREAPPKSRLHDSDKD